MHGAAGALLAVALLATSGCSGGPSADISGTAAIRGSSSSTISSGPPTQSASPFCRNLERLDREVRAVRSFDDATASVAAYRDRVGRLDARSRRVRDTAPSGFDLAALEYANGRFAELVRQLPLDLSGAEARADVVLILEAYRAAVYDALVTRCGVSSVAP